uniref:Uncharacterized protein n=1 Tax=Sphaerodactylus townsendi TaxID=933632 RepID=A0ACB8E562_9SAUR
MPKKKPMPIQLNPAPDGSSINGTSSADQSCYETDHQKELPSARASLNWRSCRGEEEWEERLATGPAWLPS